MGVGYLVVDIATPRYEKNIPELSKIGEVIGNERPKIWLTMSFYLATDDGDASLWLGFAGVSGCSVARAF